MARYKHLTQTQLLGLGVDPMPQVGDKVCRRFVPTHLRHLPIEIQAMNVKNICFTVRKGGLQRSREDVAAGKPWKPRRDEAAVKAATSTKKRASKAKAKPAKAKAPKATGRAQF